eukprot:scaffold43363_cov95-Phaeocystis_antarctica.AAC.1
MRCRQRSETTTPREPIAAVLARVQAAARAQRAASVGKRGPPAGRGVTEPVYLPNGTVTHRDGLYITRVAGTAGENPCRRPHHTSGWVRGAGTGLESSLGHDRSRIPAMASSQGDVRSSPMAYPAVRPLPKLPLPLRPETGPTS